MRGLGKAVAASGYVASRDGPSRSGDGDRGAEVALLRRDGSDADPIHDTAREPRERPARPAAAALRDPRRRPALVLIVLTVIPNLQSRIAETGVNSIITIDELAEDKR